VYFVGGFTDFGFVAQVVAELFAVAMWWACAAWDAQPDLRTALVFSVAGAAAFLTWPVYTGAPSLAFFVIVMLRSGLTLRARAAHLVAAFGLFGGFALVYLLPRLGWLQLAGTGGAAPWPSIDAYSWPLTALAVAGYVLCLRHRRGRATAIFVAALLAQTAAFYVLALRSGAPQPYMALKMFYLFLWPMVGCAIVAVGDAWAVGATLYRSHQRRVALERVASWAMVAIAFVLAARPLWREPRLLHPRPPAISAPLYAAGGWARANLPPACIEYLVGDDETAYWLHLAVLGNPRVWDRTGDNATYEPTGAVIRWLTPGGLPYAIADLPALPRDVREELEIVRQFGPAAIVRRKGPSSCTDLP
jgi:hypothetical protein